MSAPAFRVSDAQLRVVLEHYERAAPLIAANFPNAPLVAAYYPHGLEERPTYSGDWREPLPESVSAVHVETSSGKHRYPGCSENTILWLVHSYAVGIQSWTPSARDPESVGFARLLLRPVAGADQMLLKEALLAVRTALFSRGNGLEAIPMLDGPDGAALFVPLSDAPTYEAVRGWLHELVGHAIEKHPTLLVGERHPHEKFGAARIQCTFVSDAVGHSSALPYSLSGPSDLPMVTPFAWDELGAIEHGKFTAKNSAERLQNGDVFAKLVAEIGSQRFADAVR